MEEGIEICWFSYTCNLLVNKKYNIWVDGLCIYVIDDGDD